MPALGRYGATERRAYAEPLLVDATHFKVQGHAPRPPCHLTLPSTRAQVLARSARMWAR